MYFCECLFTEKIHDKWHNRLLMLVFFKRKFNFSEYSKHKMLTSLILTHILYTQNDRVHNPMSIPHWPGMVTWSTVTASGKAELPILPNLLPKDQRDQRVGRSRFMAFLMSYGWMMWDRICRESGLVIEDAELASVKLLEKRVK